MWGPPLGEYPFPQRPYSYKSPTQFSALDQRCSSPPSVSNTQDAISQSDLKLEDGQVSDIRKITKWKSVFKTGNAGGVFLQWTETTVVKSTTIFMTKSVETNLEFWESANGPMEYELGGCAQTNPGTRLILFHNALFKRKRRHSTDLPQPLRPVLTDARRSARCRSSSHQPRKRKAFSLASLSDRTRPTGAHLMQVRE